MTRKVLVAEDETVSRRLLASILERSGYSVTQTMDGAAALKELQHSGDPPKLAILDWMMPGLNGPGVIQELRKANNDSYTYVLLLTAKNEKSDVLAGLAAGADDYLSKPFDAGELLARVRVGERILDLQGRLEYALAASKFRAAHDALTGLYNRGTIMDLLQREAARCTRETSSLGVVLADVDYFKRINDTFGHDVGDHVLLEIAGRMHSSLRSYDLLGRYGGEEFLVVAPGCGFRDVHEIGERLRQSVAGKLMSIGKKNLNVTISLGSSVTTRAGNIALLLKSADLALYDAKAAGRNIFKFRPTPADTDVRVPLALVPSPPSGEDLPRLS
ncbi:MAG TPA: diguanylate cyclase [Candidatus Angelobacter sp.]